MEPNTPNFEKFIHDAHEYTNDLATRFGHPEEKIRSLIIWRAVVHTLRDRMHWGEAMDFISPLPMIFKGMYVEGWKYTDKPPLNYSTFEEMISEVERKQAQYGEAEFSWGKSTGELIEVTLSSLQRFMSTEQLDHLIDQMPADVRDNLHITEVHH